MQRKFLLTAALAVALTAGGAAVAAKPTPAQTAAVADKNRPSADTELDAARKPAEMLEFAGVKPGDTVVDLIPGGGYFTRLFAKAVGPKGTVYAVGGPVRDPSKPPAQDALAADPNYTNIKSLHEPLAQGLTTPTPADIVWTSQNYHDLKNIKELDIAAFNKSVFNALKPGGVFVVLDHVAKPDTKDATSTVHRIDPALVKQEVTAAGFKFEGESAVLRNPKDDYTKNVFDPAVRHHTD
ncbi:MAG TPA: methyltransferase, partial [Phenylobacterium sp.]|nr:methyltransferase [Phenylobacterium sp.]